MIRKITTSATAFAMAVPAGAEKAEDTVWQAEPTPLNAVIAGSDATGTATPAVSGNALTIRIKATGTRPGIMHLQHFHGFADGVDASALPTAGSDGNGDGINDLIETEPGAGITMVPIHAAEG